MEQQRITGDRHHQNAYCGSDQQFNQAEAFDALTVCRQLGISDRVIEIYLVHVHNPV
ncbi:MAG: hypothetical protein WCQ20_06250 [Synechococcaceae cyanobacterium ELA739]